MILSGGVVWAIGSPTPVLPPWSTMRGTAARAAEGGAAPHKPGDRPERPRSARAGATPMMTLSPQPLWRHSSAWSQRCRCIPTNSRRRGSPPPDTAPDRRPARAGAVMPTASPDQRPQDRRRLVTAHRPQLCACAGACSSFGEAVAGTGPFKPSRTTAPRRSRPRCGCSRRARCCCSGAHSGA